MHEARVAIATRQEAVLLQTTVVVRDVTNHETISNRIRILSSINCDQYSSPLPAQQVSRLESPLSRLNLPGPSSRYDDEDTLVVRGG